MAGGTEVSLSVARGALRRMPVELALQVMREMGADATLKDWMQVKTAGAGNRTPFAALFGEWLGEQDSGVRLCECAGSKEELAFVTELCPGRLWPGKGALLADREQCWQSTA